VTRGVDAGSRTLVVLGAVLFGLLWEAAGRLELLGPYWLPLSSVLERLGRASDGALFLRSIGATTMEAVAGFVLGTGIAIVLAALAALAPRSRSAMHRAVLVLNAIPVLAVGPLFIAVLPRSGVPVALAAQAVTFGVFIALLAGFDSTRPAHRDLLTVLGSSSRRRLTYLLGPSAVPALLTGLKLAIPTAFVGAVVGEWFGAERGVGVLLVSAMQNYQIPLMWAAALLATAVSGAAYAAVALLASAVSSRYAE
jgi:NitT/TauT family transport system permease protein